MFANFWLNELLFKLTITLTKTKICILRQKVAKWQLLTFGLLTKIIFMTQNVNQGTVVSQNYIFTTLENLFQIQYFNI